MDLVRTSTAATVLDIGDVRDHLGIDGTGLDPVLNACQRAAVDVIERECNIQIGPATFVLTTDFPACRGDITLPKPPVVAVQSVAYIDAAGNTQTLDPTAYRVGTARPGRLLVRPGRTWPETARGGAVTITFTAGHALNNLPESLLHAVRLLVGHYFENREATSTLTVKDVPFEVEMILNQHRFMEAV
ncbi:MAG TPA: head-tail connector protein [Tepidisphaeraceae bacterium]|jgi:uncharacterized phiE125 gp8 family phage protein